MNTANGTMGSHTRSCHDAGSMTFSKIFNLANVPSIVAKPKSMCPIDIFVMVVAIDETILHIKMIVNWQVMENLLMFYEGYPATHSMTHTKLPKAHTSHYLFVGVIGIKQMPSAFKQ